MRQVGLIALVALVGLLIGVGTAWMLRPAAPEPVSDSGAEVGDYRPPFRHGDLDGQWISADDFDGQILLVNFWATWCAPCRREMPVLQDASQAHDGEVSIVGIAMDDPGAVRDFVEELGISYPILVGSTDVLNTQRAWGNRSGALPYTVLVDREGYIRWQHLGEVTGEELAKVLGRYF
jgi:thiol-disulfide isomerase/thioredoxin